eukprot:6176667-Pleurochrysis_carterae.AAC.3
MPSRRPGCRPAASPRHVLVNVSRPPRERYKSASAWERAHSRALGDLTCAELSLPSVVPKLLPMHF